VAALPNRHPPHAPIAKLNESPTQSNVQSAYTFRYTTADRGVPRWTRLAPDEQIAGLLQESLASRDAPMQDDRDQRSQADLLTINPAGASKKKSLELHGRPSFAKPARAVSPSVDALADQAIDARHVNVICFLDHAWW